MTVSLEFKRFQAEHYSEYASWFADPELNHFLGPMDTDWLEAILSQSESEGVTWAVFRENEMVAVVETVFDPDKILPAGITAIATKPSLRQQGIGTAVLRQILAFQHRQGIPEHIAYISQHNPAGQKCLEKVGFKRGSSEPNEHGFHEYRHTQLHNPPTN